MPNNIDMVSFTFADGSLLDVHAECFLSTDTCVLRASAVTLGTRLAFDCGSARYYSEVVSCSATPGCDSWLPSHTPYLLYLSDVSEHMRTAPTPVPVLVN